MNERSLLRIHGQLKDLATIRRFVAGAARPEHVGTQAMQDMLIAVNEAITNIMIHGYRTRPGFIELEVAYVDGDLVVWVRDRAPLFDPTIASGVVSEPGLGKPFAGGMGISMMERLTDELIYRRTSDGGNELVLIQKGLQDP